jgi:maltokinase
VTFVEELVPHLPEWLGRQRWFGAKGREVSAVEVASATSLTDAEPLLDLLVLAVSFADGGRCSTTSCCWAAAGRRGASSEHVTIGRVGGLCAYDALWDHTRRRGCWSPCGPGARSATSGSSRSRAPRSPPGLGRVMGAEQSNTSWCSASRPS